MLLVSAESPAIAQDAIQHPQVDERVEVIRLNHSNAPSFAEQLQNLMPDILLSADARRNALLLRGTSSQLERVHELVKELDVPPPEHGPEETIPTIVRALPLQYTTVDEQLVRSVQLLLPMNPFAPSGPRLALDRQHNQIVARGTDEALAEVESILRQFDRPMADDDAQQEERTGGQVRLRVVWLVSKEAGTTRAVPEDMLEVVDELQGLGITGLGLGAQTMIQTVLDDPFSSSSFTQLNARWNMTIQGTVSAERDQFRLTLRISTRSQRPPSTSGNEGHSVDSAEFETTILTASGHSIVLTMSPIGTMDSVFVVQLTDTAR